MKLWSNGKLVKWPWRFIAYLSCHNFPQAVESLVFFNFEMNRNIFNIFFKKIADWYAIISLETEVSKLEKNCNYFKNLYFEQFVKIINICPSIVTNLAITGTRPRHFNCFMRNYICWRKQFNKCVGWAVITHRTSSLRAVAWQLEGCRVLSERKGFRACDIKSGISAIIMRHSVWKKETKFHSKLLLEEFLLYRVLEIYKWIKSPATLQLWPNPLSSCEGYS